MSIYLGNDIYNGGSTGGDYPPPGGVGSDIVIETLGGVYDAGNAVGFSGTDLQGEWFAGAFVCPFDKLTDVAGFVCGNLPDPTALAKISIHTWAGVKLGETPFFVIPSVGAALDFFTAPIQLQKGFPYRFCVWSQKNAQIQYNNGLQNIGAINYGLRSSGTVPDIPANIVVAGIASPVYVYGVIF